MNRLPDWQTRLEAFARERMTAPFVWGVNDCATFAADAVQAMTGVRLCANLRGLSVRECIAFLREHGDVRGLARDVLGEPIPTTLARVGDVVVIQAGKREALAICNGGTAIAPGPCGMAAVPMQQALAAWRVG